jgi:Rps23 Pro-64 3,4-dihydroxylase Tpa1-like proline 4-hydroxylase
MIQVIDNFLSDEEFNFALRFCMNTSYRYGEADNEHTPPTGMYHAINKTDEIYKLFETKTKTFVPNHNLYRMYINCFAPSENPYFHTDGNPEEITFLYYSNDSWNIDDGGETQFLINNNIYGILPIPNRLIYFDASILHKATSFRNKHRFSIAIKYETSSLK